MLLVLSLSACGDLYRVSVVGGADLVISCSKQARAGETVTVETKTVTDGWLETYVNGKEAKAIQGDIFQFVMPEENADVRVLFVGDDLA